MYQINVLLQIEGLMENDRETNNHIKIIKRIMGAHIELLIVDWLPNRPRNDSTLEIFSLPDLPTQSQGKGENRRGAGG